MEMPGSDIDIAVQSILLASSNHDVPKLRDLLRNTAASVSDHETGMTPLHAAVLACEPEEEAEHAVNGVESQNETEDESKPLLEGATDTIRYLLRKGALWDAVDVNGRTAACDARRLGIEELYQLLVDQGVRAELLKAQVAEYEPLPGDESESVNGIASSNADGAVGEELQLPATAPTLDAVNQDISDAKAAVTSIREGVRLGPYQYIIQTHVDALLHTEGLRVLSIGQGSGLLNALIQAKSPKSHDIVEDRANAIAHLQEQRWADLPGVKINQSAWSSFAARAPDDLYDAVFLNSTHSSHQDLRAILNELVPQCLRDGGKFSFLNVFGIERQVTYDVFQKLIDMDLLEEDLDVEWKSVAVLPPGQSASESEERSLLQNIEHYRLPICTLT